MPVELGHAAGVLAARRRRVQPPPSRRMTLEVCDLARELAAVGVEVREEESRPAERVVVMLAVAGGGICAAFDQQLDQFEAGSREMQAGLTFVRARVGI